MVRARILCLIKQTLFDNDTEGVQCALNFAGDRKAAEETLAKLSGTGHAIVQGSVFEHDTVRDVVKATVETLGGIDILVSNAGWTKFGDFSDLNSLSDEDWLRCFQCNVMSHKWLVQESAQQLRSNKGAVVIMSSIAGVRPSGSSMVRFSNVVKVFLSIRFRLPGRPTVCSF